MKAVDAADALKLDNPIRRRAALSLGVDRVTAEVVSAMDAAAIPNILLKGPSIERLLYPTGRTYGDSDLLVRRSDFARAKVLLQTLGFEDVNEGFAQVERTGALSVEAKFVRPPSKDHGSCGIVDLHINLPFLPTPDEHVWGVLSSNVEFTTVAGAQVHILRTAAVVLHVVLHAVQHDFGLHTDEDLRRAIAQLPLEEWKAVVAVAGQLGVIDLLGYGLRHHPAGVDIADRLELPASSARQWALLRNLPGTAALSMLWGAPTWSERMRRAGRAMVPTPAKIFFRFEIPASSGWGLLRGYLAWWRHVTVSIAPAARAMLTGRRGGKRPRDA